MSSGVEPRWQELLTLARDHMEGIGLTRKDWTWGGGTVLMLRHEHRLSWDVDLFLNDIQYLSYLSPRLNDTIAASVGHYTEQSNHLRCFVDGVGEIDYMTAAPVVDLKPDRMEVDGHGPLQVMSDREILAQKIYYRASNFTGRDLFDFATITHTRPELLQDAGLKEVAGIRRDALENRFDAAHLQEGFEDVVLHPNATVNLSFIEAQDAMKRWLDGDDAAPAARRLSTGPTA